MMLTFTLSANTLRRRFERIYVSKVCPDSPTGRPLTGIRTIRMSNAPFGRLVHVRSFFRTTLGLHFFVGFDGYHHF